MHALTKHWARGTFAFAALVLAASSIRAQQSPSVRNATAAAPLLDRASFAYVVSLDTAIARSSDHQSAGRDTTLWTRRQHIYVGMVVGAVGFATVGLIETWNAWSTCSVANSGSGGGCAGTSTKVVYRTVTGVAFGALGAMVGAEVGSLLRADSLR